MYLLFTRYVFAYIFAWLFHLMLRDTQDSVNYIMGSIYNRILIWSTHWRVGITKLIVHRLHDRVLSKYFELSMTSLIYINVSWFFSDSIFAKLTLHRKSLPVTSGRLNLCALLRCHSTINLLAEKLFKMLVSRLVMSIIIFFSRH